MRGTELKWWAYKPEWGRIEGTREVIIRSVKVLDKQGNETYCFQPNQDFIVKVDFFVKEKVKEPHFGVAIFREDGVYCYGSNTLLDNHAFDYLNEGNGWFNIRYNNFPFLPGFYRISVAIWDKKEVLAYCYHSGFYKFKIEGINPHHQLFNMPYECSDSIQSNAFGYDNILSLQNLRDIWGKSLRYEDEVNIQRVEFLDVNNHKKKSFKTHDQLKIKVFFTDFKTRNRILWIGIFREDGIYCHGIFKKVEADEESFVLFYPKLPLLNGNYFVSVGLSDLEKRKIAVCHHGVYLFKILSDLKDHGTVYCGHEWNWLLP